MSSSPYSIPVHTLSGLEIVIPPPPSSPARISSSLYKPLPPIPSWDRQASVHYQCFFEIIDCYSEYLSNDEFVELVESYRRIFSFPLPEKQLRLLPSPIYYPSLSTLDSPSDLWEMALSENGRKHAPPRLTLVCPFPAPQEPANEIVAPTRSGFPSPGLQAARYLDTRSRRSPHPAKQHNPKDPETGDHNYNHALGAGTEGTHGRHKKPESGKAKDIRQKLLKWVRKSDIMGTQTAKFGEKEHKRRSWRLTLG
ncbi:hypothetical protein MMC10_011326 [Thelotrema lepadinum]|nr:hypothetical protein [Thelotrema lepadinum]